jgi:hypothetical protein
MKFNFRKITSAIASTAILGSTVALAAAANFPAPFVQNGAADVAIVYGNSLDLVAVTDISTSLSSALAGSGGSGAPAGNDAYPLFTSSTPLQLNNSLNSVRTTATENSLPIVLADADFSGNVDAQAQFQITLGSNPRVIYAKEPTTSSDPTAGLFFATSAASYLYNATVTFDEAVALNSSDSEGESITLFGQDYTISSATDDSKIVLFKSAETIFLSVGSASSVPSQTVDVDGVTYTIELVAASDTSATIKVTNSAGQSDQKEINEAGSKKIMGVEVAVNTADESTATNVIQAEILVGANRLTLQDGEEVQLGTDNTAIDGTNVDFATGSTTGAMTQFTVQVFAPDGSHDFLGAGDEFVDPVFGSFRLLFDGLAVNLDDVDSRENIEIKPSGTDMAAISFTDWQGNSLSSWEWLNNKSGDNPAAFLGSDDNWRLIVREQSYINESGFAMVGNEDEGVLVELTTVTNGTTGYSDDEVKFTNVLDPATTYTASITSEGAGTINIEGNSYTLTYADNKAGDGSQGVRLNFPDSGTAGQLVAYPTIETSKGAKLAFFEPLTIDLDSVDGAGQDSTGFRFPDGDGFTDVTVASFTRDTARIWNFTFGTGSTISVNTTAGQSATGTIGTLSYNFTFPATAGGNTTTLYLREGGSNVLRPGVVLFEEQDESSNYNTVIVETSGAGVSDNGVSVSESSFSWNGDTDMKGSAYGNTGTELESANDMFVKLDQWGTLVTTDQTDSDQYSMDVSYPDEQAVAMIYLDGLAAGSGSRSLGDVKVMDDELSSSGMSGKNLIVVGGSCVNTAASTLLGNAGCGASWTAATGKGSGEWVIQSFANPWASSKVATLVAGWEQGDTANAATYLRTKNPDVSVGKIPTFMKRYSAVGRYWC